MSKEEITRRELLRLGMAAPLVAAVPGILNVKAQRRGNRLPIEKSASAVVPVTDATGSGQVKLIREWKGLFCRSRLINRGGKSVKIKEVVLFDLPLSLPTSTRLYGEGFQMLSQTGGTLGQPADLGNYTDAKHYKIPAPAGASAFYGMMMLTPPEAATHLLAFTSCRRFIGQFHLKDSILQVVVDTEGL